MVIFRSTSKVNEDRRHLNALNGTSVVSLVADLWLATKNSMTDTPTWLSKENAAPAPAPAAESLEINTGDDNTASRSTTAQDDADLPGIILMMRLANMGVATALMACSVRSNDGYRLESSWHCGTYDSVLILRSPGHSRLSIDFSHGRLAIDIQLGLGSLCNMRWIVGVLLGNAAQVSPGDDCRQLWIFV
jgi:hypothetical protein